MKIPFEWESIFDANKNVTCRAKVIGGWLVRSLTYYFTSKDAILASESMVFISDPEWRWEIE